MELIKELPDCSVDCIITDPPYNMTACEWDCSLDLWELWAEFRRVIKSKGNILIFSSQPFTTDLINSNRNWFRYEIIWDKLYGTDIFNAKKKLLKSHENILLFNQSSGVYNPQMEDSLSRNRRDRQKNYKKGVEKSVYGKQEKYVPTNDEMKRYPKTVFYYSNQADECHRDKRVHPTQKPLELLKWLIKTYTNENELILDPFAGSGTVLVACQELNRRGVGFEIKEEYITLTKTRINQKNIHHFSNTLTSAEVNPAIQESLISVKRESADSQNSPHIDNTNKEEANFS